MAGAGSERRRAFARAVFANLGRAEAAAKAGYHCSSAASAQVLANRLMKHPDVMKELEQLEAAARTEAVASREEALELLTRVMRFSPRALLTPEGMVDLAKAQESGAVELVESVEVADTEAGRRVRVRFPDRQAAIDRLAKLLGWNKPEQHEIKHTSDLRAALAELTDEELGITGAGAAVMIAEAAAVAEPPSERTPAPAAVKPKRKRKRKRRPPAADPAPTETPAL